MYGGRAAYPHQYIFAGTPFSGDLFEGEHLVLDDEISPDDHVGRRKVQQYIKQIVSRTEHRCHPKGGQPFVCRPFWIPTFACNDDPHSIQVLPALDDAMNEKFMHFKVHQPNQAFPSTDSPEAQILLNLIAHDLPAYAAWLERYQIPAHIKGGRFGVRPWHHPEIVKSLTAIGPEMQLLSLIDGIGIWILDGDGNLGLWTGTAGQLRMRLLKTDYTTLRNQAAKLLTSDQVCGQCLSQLVKMSKLADGICPGRVTKSTAPRKKNERPRYEIKPPPAP
jgi:hypothetical protein